MRHTHSQSFHTARQLSAASVFSGPSLCKIYSISCLETVLFWNSAPHCLLHLTDYFTLPTLSPLFWLTPKLDSVFLFVVFFLSVCPLFSFFSVYLPPCPLSPLVSLLHPPRGDNSPSLWGLTRGPSTMVHLWGLHPLRGTVERADTQNITCRRNFFFSFPEATNDCHQLCQILSASLRISAS